MIIVNLRKRTITVPGKDYAQAAAQAETLRQVALILGRILHLPGY